MATSTKTPLTSATDPVSYTIKVNNKELNSKLVVLKIDVWSEVNKISRASISIVAGDIHLNKFSESEEASFEPGKEVEISLGFKQTNAVVFKGVILRHRIEVREGYNRLRSRSLLVLECADKAIKMTIERKSEIFEKKKDSEVMTTLASTAGLSKTITATKTKHDFLTQYDMTDWDFLLRRAKANGMIVLNSQNSLTIKKPAVSGSSLATITYGTDSIRFQGEVDSSTQLQGLQASSWDYFKEAEVKQTGSEPANLTKPGNLVGKTIGKTASPTTFTFSVKTPIDVTTEMKDLADAALLESRMKRVRGEVAFRGMNTIKPGVIITLAGFGTRFNGDVFVSAVRHLVEDGKYTTTAGFGLSGNDPEPELLEENNSWISAIKGLHVGIVKKLDGDPGKKNRIQVNIPSLKSTGNGLWCILSQFYTANQSGSFFVPELNTPVLVGFLNEDPRYPVILGSLYNNKTKPKETLAKENSIKSFLTKAKLTMEFNDKDKVITLKTPGGHSIVISDKDKGISLKDKHGNSIITNDKGITISSKKSITLDSKDKIKISATKGITATASGGDITLDGKGVTAKAKAKFAVKANGGADIQSSATVNIKGSMVNIN
jgi:phage protein D